MTGDLPALVRDFVKTTEPAALERFSVELFAVRTQLSDAEAMDLLLDMARAETVTLWVEYKCDRCDALQPNTLRPEEVLPDRVFECTECGKHFRLDNDADYRLKFGFRSGVLKSIIEDQRGESISPEDTRLFPPPLAAVQPLPGTSVGRTIDRLKRDFEAARLRNDREAGRVILARLRELPAQRGPRTAQECSQRWPGLE